MNRLQTIEFIKNAPTMKPDEMTPEQKAFYNRPWDDLTDDEKEMYLSAWEMMPGTLENITAKSGTPSELATTAKVLKSIIDNVDDVVDNIPITELMVVLEHITKRDRESNGN